MNMLRIVALAWMAMAFMLHGSAIAEEVTRVFLFAGQSNMVGADSHADRIDDYRSRSVEQYGMFSTPSS